MLFLLLKDYPKVRYYLFKEDIRNIPKRIKEEVIKLRSVMVVKEK